MTKIIATYVLCVTFFVTTNGHYIKPSEHFNNSVVLDSDGKYILFWKFNDTHIIFEINVETLGYVGFGISPNGNMYPSDVVVGWVKDGVTYFTDRHTVAHSAPEIDKSQDWFLLHGEEVDQRTVLKFTRKLDTCDPDDKVIDDQTVRLIYSYHPDDPTSDTNLTYHGPERRGTKSLSLLSNSLPPPDYKDDRDIKLFEFRNRNYQVPAKDTTYSCTAFQMPDLGEKHHMIEYEPVFTPGNEHHVHHITIMRCDGVHPELDMKTEECMGPFPSGWPSCSEIFAGWGTGGGPFYFPEEAGYPVGGPHDASFYVMQMHYNNPTNKTDIIDSSGIRIRMTTKLRQHDVGSMNIGAIVTNYMVIPPGEKGFISRSYCGSECITNAMNITDVQEFKIIAGFLHAHLLGVRVTTRHFRNGIELDPVADDPYYDINFQEMRPYTPPRTVLPGDSFVVECTYNSLDYQSPIFGGFSTKEEMCTSFLYIYPDIHMMACQSMPVFEAYKERGAALHQKFLTMDWTDQRVKVDFYNKLDNSTVYHQCVNRIDDKMAVDGHYYKEQVKPYVPKVLQQSCS